MAVCGITFFSISAEESLIPSWIKNTAGFWVNNQINDKEFITALQWLIDNGILTVSQKDPELDALEQEMQKRMLENMLKDPKDAPIIGIGYDCIDNWSGDVNETGETEFIVDVKNHDTVSHSPIIEIQDVDEYQRPINTLEIDVGKLDPNQVKTVKGSVENSRLGGYCNVLVKKVN